MLPNRNSDKESFPLNDGPLALSSEGNSQQKGTKGIPFHRTQPFTDVYTGFAYLTVLIIIPDNVSQSSNLDSNG